MPGCDPMIASIECSSQPPFKISSSVTFMVRTDFQVHPDLRVRRLATFLGFVLVARYRGSTTHRAHGVCLKAVRFQRRESRISSGTEMLNRSWSVSRQVALHDARRVTIRRICPVSRPLSSARPRWQATEKKLGQAISSVHKRACADKHLKMPCRPANPLPC